ncbi:MAG TPA: hypothetical protein DEP69_02980 [Acidimicrobiaceae bacterium]|nr:hypothetical protein [Acidimicrobiaceae bacterium]
MPAVNTLRTARLRMRPLKSSDFAEWSEVRVRCEPWLSKWEPAPPPKAPDPAVDRQAFAARCRVRDRERQLGTGFAFGMWHERRFCGEVNISGVVRGAFNSGHVGYWIDERVAGLGLVGEAVVAVLGYGFDVVRLERMQISVVPRNVASRRVIEKLGLRAEGVAVEYLQIDGRREDHIRYAMTVDEWDRRKAELKIVTAPPRRRAAAAAAR